MISEVTGMGIWQATSSPSPKKAGLTNADGCQTPMSFLESNDDFSMFLQMVNATSPKAHLKGACPPAPLTLDLRHTSPAVY